MTPNYSAPSSPFTMRHWHSARGGQGPPYPKTLLPHLKFSVKQKNNKNNILLFKNNELLFFDPLKFFCRKLDSRRLSEEGEIFVCSY